MSSIKRLPNVGRMSAVLRTQPFRLVRILVAVTFLLPFTTAGPVFAGAHNGVDDLRGRWEFVVSDLADEPLPFDIFINDLEPDPDSETGNDYLAAGCMRSTDSGATTPMSLRATDLGGGDYDLSLLSTAGPPPSNGEPYVIQFLGTVETNGRGVPDDVAGGTIRTGWFEGGEWSGTHHDRRRTHCPPVDEIPPPGLYFQGDVYVHHGYEGDTVSHKAYLLEAYTNIVSNGMQVILPDGTVVIVPFYTDIFSPHVDFISEFRYLESYPGDAVSGEPYEFTLLDALGDPIAGTTRTDAWTGCLTYPPPQGLFASVAQGLDIELSWNPVSSVSGFDPANEIGFYQIGIWPWEWGGDTQYGASGIKSPEHVIPWNRGHNWPAGDPDGWDHGDVLSELQNGKYQLEVEAFSEPDPDNPGSGLECAVWDSAENLFFTKSEEGITFFTP